MSHRQQEKARLRAEREATEQQREAAARRRRLLTLGGIVAGVIVAVVVIILLSSGGGDDDGGTTPAERQRETSALFTGLPQKGISLGNPDAPVVLTEFADLQCPFCREYAVGVLPTLIQRYVRTGRMRLELKLLRFIGPDSERGARGALAAGQDNRMWNFADAFYRDQGTEGTGYATDEFLTEVARAAGVNPSSVLRAVREQSFERELARFDTEARAAGITSTPSFLVARRGGRPRRLEVAELTSQAFEEALAPELSR